jgi:hypothetical protein
MNTSNVSTHLLRTALLACVLPLAARAQYVVDVTQDTFVANSAGDSSTTNFSTSPTLQMTQIANGDYQSYPLLQFNLSSFAGETVTSNATLTLQFNGYNDQGGLYPHSGDNVQLLALGSAVNFSTITYAGFLSGGDAVRTDLESLTAIGGLQSYNFGAGATQNMTFTIPETVVQSWINSPATNFGFVLFRAPEPGSGGVFADNAGMDFSSSNGAQGPTLSFSAVPEPSTYAAIVGAMMLVGVACFRRKAAKLAA